MKPYVGISCIQSASEAKTVAQQFISAGMGRDKPVQGMLGYAVDWQMVRDDCFVPQANKKRYVSLDSLTQIMHKDQKFGINMVHFVPQAGNDEQFVADVRKIFNETGLIDSGTCSYLQLNWGTSVGSRAVSQLKEAVPGLNIIFQVGEEDMSENSTEDLVGELGQYAPYVDGFLIDPSQGQGKDFNARDIVSNVVGIRKVFPEYQIVLTGGLSPENIAEKIAEFRSIPAEGFSIDVESGVRDAGDNLDLNKTKIFIDRAAASLLP